MANSRDCIRVFGRVRRSQELKELRIVHYFRASGVRGPFFQHGQIFILGVVCQGARAPGLEEISTLETNVP